MKLKNVHILLAGLVPFFIGFNPICMGLESSGKPAHFFEAGRLVDIGNERKIYLACQGSGSPTVLFISGRSDRSDIWLNPESNKSHPLSVYSEVAKFTRACAYDRPGTFTIIGDEVLPSRSSRVTQPITPKDAVADLHALLTHAKIEKPLVLVAHSYGGLIARLYAICYPNDVVGLVLVDPLTEFLFEGLTAAEQTLWIRLNSNYTPEIDKYTVQERTDFIPSFKQMKQQPSLAKIPSIILTSDQPYDFQSLIKNGILPADSPIDFGPIVFKAHQLGNQRLTSLLDAKQITNTKAGHYIQTEQPQLVIDAILEIVGKVRKEAT